MGHFCPVLKVRFSTFSKVKNASQINTVRVFLGSKTGDVFTKNTPAGYVRLGFLGLGFRFQVLGFRVKEAFAVLSRMARVSSIRVYPGLAFAYIPSHPCTQEKNKKKEKKRKKKKRKRNKNGEQK